MEGNCAPEFEWQRWSQNRESQCDVLVRFFADRVGRQPVCATRANVNGSGALFD